MERIAFIRRARALGFSLDEVGEILRLREQQEAPCHYTLQLLSRKIEKVDARIADLRATQRELRALHEAARAIPAHVLSAKGRICHIIENQGRKVSAESASRPPH